MNGDYVKDDLELQMPTKSCFLNNTLLTNGRFTTYPKALKEWATRRRPPAAHAGGDLGSRPTFSSGGGSPGSLVKQKRKRSQSCAAAKHCEEGKSMQKRRVREIIDIAPLEVWTYALHHLKQHHGQLAVRKRVESYQESLFIYWISPPPTPFIIPVPANNPNI
ncbi:hypothetical protein TREMEDRAFT_58084 [Tremella mesenterica DSM 1558]|uniref:uncharacterized protein n=1 Tax=Tremella mesenterica (strain ATCC 24925 / CBS 8224 / DSM 1558 / NBRC 9311 / NRRL Y-6157 / RJB 2259-6 / UBC 559-6) TaxID=578456 RepID=UPI0003F49D2E|nr:uncharacterized protein TREMEDRAFT_58084 [Tremella mesenterica DSM 1558]EIW71940.1 hypothetical protein TREMEDRAFT_58084 [Tremella mesenterica DSM 1558]